MFEGLSLENMVLALYREGDYTVRLFNREMPSPKRYLFALLRFDSGRGIWTINVLDQNLRYTLGEEETAGTFPDAKQALMDTIGYLWGHLPEYKITKVDTGYYIPPWLQRKRPIPTLRQMRRVQEDIKRRYQ